MSCLMKKILILFGGRSTEHDASIHSYYAIRDEILEANQEHMVSNVIYISRDFEVYAYRKLSDLNEGIENQSNLISMADLIYIFQRSDAFMVSLLHGNEGEDGCFQGIAELMGAQGSFGSVFAASITMSKWASQVIANHVANGLVFSPKTLVVRKEDADRLDLSSFGNSIVVKPNSLGASLFTWKLTDYSLEDVQGAIHQILKYDSTALIQECIEGREYTFGIIKKNNKLLTLPLVEAISESGFLSFEKKHKRGMVASRFITEEESVYQLIRNVSIKLFKAFEIANMARFDYIYRAADSKLYFLEANTIPGLGKNSIFPKILNEANLNRIDLINAVITCDSGKLVNKTYRYSIEV